MKQGGCLILLSKLISENQPLKIMGEKIQTQLGVVQFMEII